VRIDIILFWFVIVFSGVIIIVDSHRSVWLTAGVAAATLFWIKEINYRYVIKNIPLIAFSCIIIFFITHHLIMVSLKTNLFDFIIERTTHFIQIDEGYENTAAWRVTQWKMQMQKFYAKPIIGQGFGGYWGFSGNLGVSPHSLYVQTLVKLGIVGMLLYLLIVIKIFARLKSAIARYKIKPDPEMAILITSMVILFASHAFYAVYSFEYYSLLYIGLGVAASPR
jgi:O-antigen ligase